MPVRKLKEFLDREQVRYESLLHTTAYTAQEVAASAHITGKEMAKTVIVELDGKMAMAVLPANRKIVLQDLREVTGSELVDALGRRQVLQAVLAQITQLTLDELGRRGRDEHLSAVQFCRSPASERERAIRARDDRGILVANGDVRGADRD